MKESLQVSPVRWKSLNIWSRGLRGALALAVLLPQPQVFAMVPLDPQSAIPSSEEAVVYSNEANLKSISYEGHTVRIQLDKEVPYRVFSLSTPPRVVVELPKTIHSPKPYEAAVKDGFLKRIRSAQFKTTPERLTRIVLDLPRMVPYTTEKEGATLSICLDDASLPKEEKRGNSLEGQAVETVEAAALERSGGGKYSGRPKDLLANLPRNPITIDFDEADVRDVIRVLSEMSGINMIYASDLRGFVTIHLNQVPFNEVFNTVLTMQGLVSQQIGHNILRILTPAALSAERGNAVLSYRTFLLNYGKAAEVASHLGAVRVNAAGRVTVDERNNALVVTDTPEGLDAADRLINELDRKPPQVLIETKLVQIDLDKSLDLGIQWEYGSNRPLGNNNPNSRRLIGQRFIESNGPLGTAREISVAEGKVGFATTDNTGADAIFYPADAGSRGTGVALPGPTAAGISFGFINSSEMLTATLGALETERSAKTLTNPKIITTNNQPANIQIGSRVPFLQTTVSPGGAATQSTVFANVGFIIDVTPTINEDNQIRLKVKPESSSVTGLSDSGPTIKTTSADTEVILKDGDTIVIGGLVSDASIESVRKVPLLGDLPVLGVFFRSLSTSKVRQELLVFITARIVPN